MIDIDAIARRLGTTPTPIKPQKRTTSKPLKPFEKYEAILLTGPYNLPTVYTRKGTPAKRQPDPKKPGDLVYVAHRGDGLINIYPFSLAGSGYELVIDAEEGVHYRFV